MESPQETGVSFAASPEVQALPAEVSSPTLPAPTSATDGEKSVTEAPAAAAASGDSEFDPSRLVRAGLPPLKIQAATSGPDYARVFYRRTNSVYGKKQPEALEGPKHPLTNEFTGAIEKAGNWRNNSLTCSTDKARFIDGAQDWLLKLR